MTWLRASHLVALSLGIFFPAACVTQTPPATGQNQLLNKAQTGDSDAQYQLGLLYERGSTDTPKDYPKALEWFRRSAEKGNPKGENALGIAYGHGYGVVEDDAVAFNWFYKAALKGYPAAQHNLASDYRSGRGTPKNESAAFDWSLKAALNGEATSQLMLCATYQKSTSGELDPTMAYAWCLIAQASAPKHLDTHKAYTDKQLELLMTYTDRVRVSLSPVQLQEASSLASTWNAGHPSGATMPRHSRFLLALIAADGPPQRASDNASKPAERTRRYARSNGCETGHWVDSVLSDGEIVKLEDGTIWKIDDTDTVDSSLWLDTEDVTVCAGKLINTDDKTSVGAHQIH